MSNLVKQIASFSLPVTVVVIVPSWIEAKRTVSAGVSFACGVLLIALGLTVMIITISSFIRIGKGTLAPWSPTKKLVIHGPYRYVRNPMIMGVLPVLLGEACVLWSQNILMWAGTFFVFNTIYFLIYEEPDLEHRFGADYGEYKKNVHRWVPRIRPYRQN